MIRFDLQPNIRESNPVVKQDPTIYIYIHTYCMNDCNEWKKEKCHSCTIIRKLQTQIMWAAVCDIASGMGHKISGHLNISFC